MFVDTLISRCGNRGAWLVLMGTVWIAFGVGTFLTPIPARPWVLVEYLPAFVQAFGWWATGAVAIWVGLRRRVDDSPGHVALYVMPAVKLVSFIVSTVVYAGTTLAHVLAPTIAVQGYPASWYAALIWVLVSVMLAQVAAWPNPAPPLVEPPTDAGGRA